MELSVQGLREVLGRDARRMSGLRIGVEDREEEVNKIIMLFWNIPYILFRSSTIRAHKKER